jgi:hypothetical protein
VAFGKADPVGSWLDPLLTSKQLLGTALLWWAGAASLWAEPAAARVRWRLAVAASATLVVLATGLVWLRDTQRLEASPIQPAPAASLRAGLQPADAAWDDGIRLVALGLPDRVSRGGDLDVVLLWESAGPRGDYTASIQLRDAAGRACGQHDARPNEQRTPTITWFPGAVIRHSHRVAIPPDCLPGTYDVWLSLYTQPAIRRLPLEDGSLSLRLGTVRTD